MFLEALPIIRDASVVFLVLQWMVLLALPLYLLIKIVQGLSRFLPKVRPGIRTGHGYVRQGLGYVDQAMSKVRAPFVWLNKTLLATSEWIARATSAIKRG